MFRNLALVFVFQRALNSFFEADMERVFEVEDLPESKDSPKPKRQRVEEQPAGDW